MPLGMDVGLGPARPHSVRWEPSSTPRRGTAPQFSAHVCSGQTAGCIQMPLGTKVDLRPGCIVLDGDPVPPKKGCTAPPILAYALSKGCVDQDATWYGGRPWPNSHCVTWGPSPLNRGTAAPNFRPMSVVTKRLAGSRCHLVWR